MKIQNLILFLLLSGTTLLGQTENKSIFQIGYYGDVIFHPGIKMTYLAPLSSWAKEKPNQTKFKSILVGADVSYYKSPNHHHGVILGPNLSYRREKDNGKFIQWTIMAGIHRSITDGSTFEVRSKESIKHVKLAGQTSFYNSISFLFGKKLRENLSYYAEVGLNGRTPYNNSYLTGIHVGLGIQYFIIK